MKKILFNLIFTLVFIISCDTSNIEERISNLENRVTELEKKCDAINGDIKAIQNIVSALSDNDYVTDVSPIIEDGITVGYTISFLKHDSINIYNGKNGADGQNGYTPVIGVRQDTDGIYYWTLDGEWMLGNDGDKIRAEGKDGVNGADGNDGQDGTDGQDGKDGITPQLKIENDWWYVSYDNGISWEQIGKVSDPAEENSNSLFTDIDTSNEDFIILTLSDGTQIKLPVWTAFEKLQNLCNQANEEIIALKTIVQVLQNNDYITDVSTIEESGKVTGYVISFSKNGSITIYNGKDGADGNAGQNGYTPVIGVRQDTDGIYYWTLDGEWMLGNDGDKIRAEGKDGVNGTDGNDGQDGTDGQDGKDGITPQLKIENDWWYVSYDNGISWKQIGAAISTEENESCIFQDITISDNMVLITLQDGTCLELPCYKKLDIVFPDSEGNIIGVFPGREMKISYKLVNATSETLISASSDGNYKVRIERDGIAYGNIIVSCPETYVDGFITVFVSDGNGYAFIKTIGFYENRLEFNKTPVYNIASSGGEISIPVSVNFDYTVSVEENAKQWIFETPATKSAMRDEIISLTVSANTSQQVRSGRVFIYPSEDADNAFAEISVTQSSMYFSIDRLKFTAPPEGKLFSQNITSSLGVKSIVQKGCNWISADITKTGTNNYELELNVSNNSSMEYRTATVDLYDESMAGKLASLEICQIGSGAITPDAMIFKVKASYENDFTVELPLVGDIDAYVDWGDGSVEYYNKTLSISKYMEYISHKYEEKVENYEVKISGNVERIYSGQLEHHSITEIVKWGRTGLSSMEDAFANNPLISELPADTEGTFSEVTTFFGAFQGCTNLADISGNLFTYAVSAENFFSSFRNCTKLTYLPENLFSNTVEAVNFSMTFSGCTSLESIPENLFAGNINVTDFSNLFDGCTSLTIIPGNLFASNKIAKYFSQAFAGCSNLVEIPANLFAANVAATSFASTFKNCVALTEIPENLFYNNTLAENFGNSTSSGTFYGCTSLRYIPINLFDNNRRVTSFRSTFSGCKNISGESPYTVIDGVKYHIYERHLNKDQFITPEGDDCFSRCTELDDYDNIPTEWK